MWSNLHQIISRNQDAMSFGNAIECHVCFFIVVSVWHRLKHHLVAAYYGMEHTAEVTGIGAYLRSNNFFQQKWLILNDVEGF